MAHARTTSTRPNNNRTWGCHNCGAKLQLEVVRTEHGEESEPIRLRKCRNCGEHFATEERVIPFDQFYYRAESHRKRGFEAWRGRYASCKICEQHYEVPVLTNNRAKARHFAYYKQGRYSIHVKRPEHIAILRTAPTNHSRKIERERRRKDYWKQRGIDITTATVEHALTPQAFGPQDRHVARIEDFREG